MNTGQVVAHQRPRGPASAACLVILLLFSLLLPACGLSAPQKAAVVRFGSSAADLGTIAAAEFEQSRRDVMDMNRERLALGDRSVNPEKLDGYFTIDDVAARTEAATALATYGQLLAQLAGGTESASVADAGGRLVTSLKSLRASRRIDISDEKLGAIGRAVAGIGGLYVESERARAIRQVTEASGPAIRRLAELIKRDFDPRGEHWSVGFDAAAVRLGERVANTRSDLDRAESGASGGVDAARLALRARLADADAVRGRAVQRFGEVSGRITSAAEALVLAEKDMRGVLAGSRFGLDDLDPFSDRVAELVRVYRVLRE